VSKRLHITDKTDARCGHFFLCDVRSSGVLFPTVFSSTPVLDDDGDETDPKADSLLSECIPDDNLSG